MMCGAQSQTAIRSRADDRQQQGSIKGARGVNTDVHSSVWCAECVARCSGTGCVLPYCTTLVIAWSHGKCQVVGKLTSAIFLQSKGFWLKERSPNPNVCHINTYCRESFKTTYFCKSLHLGHAARRPSQPPQPSRLDCRLWTIHNRRSAITASSHPQPSSMISHPQANPDPCHEAEP